MSKGTVRRLLSYSPDPEAPPHRTSAVTARRLLALPLTTEDRSPRRLLAADATRERINALTAAGHSLTELARVIGKPPTSLRRSLSRPSVTAQTAMSIEALYNAMALEADPWIEHLPSSVDSLELARRAGHPAAPLQGVPVSCPSFPSDDVTAGNSKAVIVQRRVARLLQSRPASIACMAHRPGPGRKSKGDRENFAVKPMRPVGDVIRANADRLGMTYGEYCAAILSTALGMPEYAPQPLPAEQQELPLKTA